MCPLEAHNPPATPPSISAGAGKLGTEVNGQEGRAGADPSKIGYQVGPGACKQGALVLINEIQQVSTWGQWTQAWDPWAESVDGIQFGQGGGCGWEALPL